MRDIGAKVFPVFGGGDTEIVRPPPFPATSVIPSKPMTAAERRIARERISPTPRTKDDDCAHPLVLARDDS